MGCLPRSVAIAALLSIFGCADDAPPAADSGSPDSGAVDAGTDTAPPIPVPEAPLLPVLTPCPEGWARVDAGDGAPVTCDPFPSPPTEPCGAGEAHFAGEEGCTAIGPPCPVDGWPGELPTDRPVLYVRAGAPAGGDGTEAAPFASISDAISVAASPSVIAVAPGRYVGALDVSALDVSIRGACLETVIESDGFDPALTIFDSTVDLRQARLIGGSDALSATDSTVGLSSVEVLTRSMGPAPAAVSMRNSSLVGESVVLRGPMSQGMRAYDDSVVDLRRASIEGAAESGVLVSFSVFRGDSVVIRDFGGSMAEGDGIFGGTGSEITLARSAIVDGFGPPVLVADGAAVALEDCAIRGPATTDAVPPGAVAVFGTSTLDLERVWISGLISNAVIVASGTHLDARDVVVVDTVALAGVGVGYGFEFAAAATATMERVYVERSVAVGVLVDGRDTIVDATDLTIARTLGNGVGTFGRGIQVQREGVLTLTRAELRDNREVGLAVARSRSSVTATDLRLIDTDQRQCAEDGGECAAAGIGIGVYEDGAVSVDRFLVAGNFLAGVQIATDGGLDLARGVVERNPVGANVQVPGYDLARLTTNVIYRDNGQNLDSAELTVPEPDVSVP